MLKLGVIHSPVGPLVSFSKQMHELEFADLFASSGKEHWYECFPAGADEKLCRELLQLTPEQVARKLQSAMGVQSRLVDAKHELSNDEGTQAWLTSAKQSVDAIEHFSGWLKRTNPNLVNDLRKAVIS